MFLRTPWLVPLLIVLLGAAALFLLERPTTMPSSNPKPQVSSQPTNAPIVKTKGNYLAIRGEFVIVGKSPDGDSVRFRPDKPKLLFTLKNPSRIKLSGDDTVQLRFEGIDAPELHFNDLEQPLGAEARDALLSSMGFNNVRIENRQVRSANPATIRGAILSQAAEGNGRPISYVFVGQAAEGFTDGSRVGLDKNLLMQSENAAMLENGFAYYTVYSSTPELERSLLRDLAQQAKNQKRGVWAQDTSAEFRLSKQSDIGVNGQLILPKLFRRASSYLDAKRKKDFSGNIKQWLVWTQNQKQSENDKVKLGNLEQRLSDWLEVRGNTVRFTGDILDAVFVDK